MAAKQANPPPAISNPTMKERPQAVNDYTPEEQELLEASAQGRGWEWTMANAELILDQWRAVEGEL